MTTITVGVDQKELEFLLNQLTELEPNNFVRDMLDETQALMLNRIRTRFLNTQAPSGDIWPVSQAAIKRNFNGKTLFDTGTLFHSIQAHTTSENEREIGTDVFYGVFHQYGTKYLPKRPFIGVSDDDVAVVQRLIVKRISLAIKENIL